MRTKAEGRRVIKKACNIMSYEGLKKLWEKHWRLVSAIVLVTICFLLWNYQNLSSGLLPKHDGLHGITAFATSMHSVRIDGEIAWWSPADTRTGGWAQYYSGFLSPLAPTYGSILFIAAACITKLCSFFGVVIPEYPFYILLNSYITPILAVFFLFKFSSFFLKNKYSYILLGGGYILSGIGLQIDSWYYWQDQFFLWLFLYGVIGILEEANSRRYYIFCASILCFFSSANYWTLHNLLFIACVLVLYLFTIQNMRDRIKKIFTIIRENKIITFLLVLCLAIWALILVSVYLEQHSVYSRGSDYSIDSMLVRAKGGNPIQLLVNELFDPIIGGFGNENMNTIHNARYVGAMLLPLIVVAFQRRGGIFHKLCIMLFGICLMPGFLLPIWQVFFRFDQHYFYFYSHFWEISVLLLAADSFDAFLEGENARVGKSLKIILAIAAAAFLVFTYKDTGLSRAVPLMLCLIVLSCIILLKYMEQSGKVWLFLFLILFLGDISRYYYEGSAADHQFTVTYFPRTGEGDERLYEPFERVENNTFSQGLKENSPPVTNHIWPYNEYILSVSYYQMLAEYMEDSNFIERVDYSFGDGQDLHFYTELSQYDGNTVSLIENRVPEAEFAFTEYGYNDFTVQCKMPQNGFVVFNLQYDPHWRLKIDGQKVEVCKANINYLSIELAEGSHTIELSYRPLARVLYPFAVMLLAGLIVYVLIRLRRKGFDNESCNTGRRIWYANQRGKSPETQTDD